MFEDNIRPHAVISQERRAAKGMSSIIVGGCKGRGSSPDEVNSRIQRQGRPASITTSSSKKASSAHERSEAHILDMEQVNMELLSADGRDSGNGSMGKKPLKRDVMDIHSNPQLCS